MSLIVLDFVLTREKKKKWRVPRHLTTRQSVKGQGQSGFGNVIGEAKYTNVLPYLYRSKSIRAPGDHVVGRVVSQSAVTISLFEVEIIS